MPSSLVACPWCSAHPKSEQYFNHLNSKHYSVLWSGKSLASLGTRIKNKSTAPIIITLPDNHTLYACLGCMSATTNFNTASKHEDRCSVATLKALSECRLPEEPAVPSPKEVPKQVSTEITDKLIEKFNLKVNTMRNAYLRRIKELEFELNELKGSEETVESEDEEEYNFKDEFARFLKGLGL